MAGDDWTREEVEATVGDYFAMLRDELAGASRQRGAAQRAATSVPARKVEGIGRVQAREHQRGIDAARLPLD
jgi:hypothetical protein